MATCNELWGTVDDGRRTWLGFRAGLGALAALLCAVSASVGCGGATEPPCDGDGNGDDCQPRPPTCLRNGTRYAEGQSAPSGDGCNTCTCHDGDWQCTLIGCSGSDCVYEGQIRGDGSSFPASDGCNTCSCQGGAVACTERDCTTVPAPCELNGALLRSGESRSNGSGCNYCTCNDGALACTDNVCPALCYGDADCGDAEYCEFPIGWCPLVSSSAGAEVQKLIAPDPGMAAEPSAPGVCSERPTVCTGGQAPVCGCDGQTYRNACAAASLGLSLASGSSCP